MQLQLRDFTERRSHPTFRQGAVLGAPARWGGYVYRARVARDISAHFHPRWPVVLGLLRGPNSAGRRWVPGNLPSQDRRARRQSAGENIRPG